MNAFGGSGEDAGIEQRQQVDAAVAAADRDNARDRRIRQAPWNAAARDSAVPAT